MARCLPITVLVLPRSPSSSGPYPVTKICTTLGDTFLISASTDWFRLRRLSSEWSCALALPVESPRKKKLITARTRQNACRLEKPFAHALVLDRSMAVASTSLHSEGCSRGYLEYNARRLGAVLPCAARQARPLNTPLCVFANKCDYNGVLTIEGKLHDAKSPYDRRSSPGRSPHSQEALEALGTVFIRAPVGHGPRRLQRGRYGVGIFSARPRPLPRLSLGRRRHRRNQRPSSNDVLQPRALEWPRSYS